MKEKVKEKKKLTFGASLGILSLIIAGIVVGMLVYGASLQMMFFLAFFVLMIIGLLLGHSNSELEKAAFDMARGGFQPIAIILSVGALIGAWIASGTVPALIYGGLVIISPTYFLLTTLLLCSVTSLATGTSWGTMGTAGLAMMGIGAGLGVPAGLTAGAVISGAYFGDKMSPLSDSTNLAPAVSGGQLIPHIKHMLYTTGPAYIIAAILFTVIGLKYSDSSLNETQIDEILTALKTSFNISFIEIIPAIILITLLVLKVSPILSILGSAIVGGVFAVFRQGHTLNDVFQYMWNGFSIESETEFINTLLNRGGVTNMINIVLIILFAFFVAGIMKEIGMLDALLNPLTEKINSRAKLIVNTMGISYVGTILGGSQTFPIVVTGTLMAPVFKRFNLKPENLSRVLEDTATLGAPLVPWNSNAVFASGMLGVSPLQYIPYAFLNWITPIISLFYGLTGITITELDEAETEAQEKDEETPEQMTG